ncbi:MAG TPA: FeoB-associated Cys-rich membrane protein [Candidatus Hungatella pullicola]|mgnify:CR=1 FL=1|nr:FeoB-associated Cys-rich membrane protein [Candidatus Hungatella pullicola]
MIAWLAANGATIIISVILIILTGLAIRSIYRNRGTCSCGCNCSGCGGHCHGCVSHGAAYKAKKKKS